MSKYIPMDLAFEHYVHVKQDLNAFEYAKICAEMSKERYLPVTESEGHRLYWEGKLQDPEHVRVIWLHDVERPNDNYLALRMAQMEHEFGFRTSYNLRVVSVLDEEWRKDLYKILELGHEFQYQHEDLVIAQGDQQAAMESFRRNLAYLRGFFPDISLAFGHGVYKSGYDSAAIAKRDGHYDEALIAELGLPPLGELYAFIRRLSQDFGEKFHYFGETHCIGGDEFAAALRACKKGDVVFFLQHPTWWSDNYDFDELKRLMRGSVFF